MDLGCGVWGLDLPRLRQFSKVGGLGFRVSKSLAKTATLAIILRALEV